MIKLTSAEIENRLTSAIESLHTVNIKLDEKVGMDCLQELGPPASEVMIEDFIKAVGPIPKSYQLFLEKHNGWKIYMNTDANLLSTEDQEKKWVRDSIQQHLDCFINAQEIVGDVINPFKIGFPIELGENRSFVIIDQTSIGSDGEMNVRSYAVENKEPVVYNNFLEYLESVVISQKKILSN